MRAYLATLHKRPDHHKRNFALAVSGGFTVLMFATWFFVNYYAASAVDATTAHSGGPTLVADAALGSAVTEVGPFESLGSSLGLAWEGLRESWGKLSGGIATPDLKSGYTEMKAETFTTYGR